MTDLGARLFRLAMLAFPRDFRSRYGAEMVGVFHERTANSSGLTIISESIDAAVAGARMRLESAQLGNSAAVLTVVGLMIMTTFALRDARPGSSAGRIDFSAHDPAGAFTLTVVDDNPVAATVDNVPLSASQIVTRGDSVILLARDGSVAIALAFDAAHDSISWTARQGNSR